MHGAPRCRTPRSARPQAATAGRRRCRRRRPRRAAAAGASAALVRVAAQPHAAETHARDAERGGAGAGRRMPLQVLLAEAAVGAAERRDGARPVAPGAGRPGKRRRGRRQHAVRSRQPDRLGRVGRRDAHVGDGRLGHGGRGPGARSPRAVRADRLPVERVRDALGEVQERRGRRSQERRIRARPVAPEDGAAHRGAGRRARQGVRQAEVVERAEWAAAGAGIGVRGEQVVARLAEANIIARVRRRRHVERAEGTAAPAVQIDIRRRRGTRRPVEG